MTSKMAGRVLTLIALLFNVGGAVAQTYTQMQWGMNKGATPYQFGANINGSWTNLGTVSAAGVWSLTPSSVTSTSTGPAWGTNYGIYFNTLANVNNLPTSSMLGGGTGAAGTMAAINGAVDVPASDNGVFLDVGVAGHVRTNNGTSPGVGLFGGAMAGANNAILWAINSICTNSPSIIAATQTGKNGVSCTTYEADVNYQKLAGGGTPTGTARGVWVVGGSEVVPSGGAYAMEISPFGSPASGGAFLPWTVGLQIDSQPTNYGILIGTVSYTNAANSSSQLLAFQGSDGTATIRTGVMGADAAGGMFIQPSATSQVNYLKDGDGNNVFTTSKFGTTTSVPATFNSTVKLASYTIVGLPACNASLLGSTATVSNGTNYATGTYGSAVSATGAVTRQVLCTNTGGATTYAWAYN